MSVDTHIYSNHGIELTGRDHESVVTEFVERLNTLPPLEPDHPLISTRGLVSFLPTKVTYYDHDPTDWLFLRQEDIYPLADDLSVGDGFIYLGDANAPDSWIKFYPEQLDLSMMTFPGGVFCMAPLTSWWFWCKETPESKEYRRKITDYARAVTKALGGSRCYYMSDMESHQFEDQIHKGSFEEFETAVVDNWGVSGKDQERVINYYNKNGVPKKATSLSEARYFVDRF